MRVLGGPAHDRAEEAARVVLDVGAPRPDVAIVLGSGLAGAADALELESELSYARLPGFATPSVAGHPGRLRVGRLAGVPTAVFLGRLHRYEGHAMDAVTLPTRVAAALGARTLISTAAVGGLDPALRPGSLVVGSDHLNFLGENPLTGWRDRHGGVPFVDLGAAYDAALAELAVACARELGMTVSRGVYAAMPGPSYETPAEIRFLRRAGATVVGMSVVPEAVAAAALGVRFAGLFCVTNVVGTGPVDHGEVTEVAGRFAGVLGELLAAMLPKI